MQPSGRMNGRSLPQGYPADAYSITELAIPECAHGRRRLAHPPPSSTKQCTYSQLIVFFICSILGAVCAYPLDDTNFSWPVCISVTCLGPLVGYAAAGSASGRPCVTSAYLRSASAATRGHHLDTAWYFRVKPNPTGLTTFLMASASTRAFQVASGYRTSDRQI